MQYILTEDEFRAMKAASDVTVQAKIIAEDYRNRLSKEVLEGLKPFLRTEGYNPMNESHALLSRLRAIFLSVPVIPPEKV